MSTQDPERAAMEISRLKNLSRLLVIGLIVVVALVSYNINIPAGRSSASTWEFVAAHPTILLHVIMAVIVLVASAVAFFVAIRSRSQFWIVLSAAGLIFVVLAFASGEAYVATLRKSALDYMGTAWLGAIVTYGTGWYVGHKRPG